MLAVLCDQDALPLSWEQHPWCPVLAFCIGLRLAFSFLFLHGKRIKQKKGRSLNRASELPRKVSWDRSLPLLVEKGLGPGPVPFLAPSGQMSSRVLHLPLPPLQPYLCARWTWTLVHLPTARVAAKLSLSPPLGFLCWSHSLPCHFLWIPVSELSGLSHVLWSGGGQALTLRPCFVQRVSPLSHSWLGHEAKSGKGGFDGLFLKVALHLPHILRRFLPQFFQ